MNEISLERPLKILGRARPYPKFGEFFPSTLWKGNSVGVASLLEKIRVWLGQKVSQNCYSSCMGVVKNVPECPFYNY